LPPSRPVPDPDRVARAVRAAGRGLPLAPACLGSAIVGHAMLDANGHPSDIRIGVTKADPDELEAHAWVERDGHVLVGDLPDLSRYRPLAVDGRDGEPERPVGW
ncbi:MAG TPA: lasso peptide biosynthesis B2 protein, partial [Halobacteriales archaeon]|nr:lasso peptide biosynthesis B2 protein [Halobacteriales archaeon]